MKRIFATIALGVSMLTATGCMHMAQATNHQLMGGTRASMKVLADSTSATVVGRDLDGNEYSPGDRVFTPAVSALVIVDLPGTIVADIVDPPSN